MERILKVFRGMGFVVHVVLRDLFGCKMEKLTGGWREFKGLYGNKIYGARGAEKDI